MQTWRPWAVETITATDAVAVRVGPLESKCHEVAGGLGLVMEIGQGLVLAHHQEVGTAVVVQVAGCQTAAEPGTAHGGPAWSETSTSRPPARPS